MLRLTLAQMRRSLGRLVAAGLAITLGTAFVAATLLAGNAITRTTLDAASSGYADADLVVSAGDDVVTDTSLAAMSEVPGVAAVQGTLSYGAVLQGPSGGRWVELAGRASDPRLEPADVVTGGLPSGTDQVALPEALAEQLGVGIGDTVELTRTPAEPGSQEVTDVLEVTGLLDVPSAFLTSGGSAVVDQAQLRGWLDADLGQVWWDGALVALDGGQDVAAAKEHLSQAVPALQVLTRDEQAAKNAAELTGSTTALTAVVLAFAAVALLVAALVIANTFQVLVAQRTRTLALLRCVGADRRQLRRSVLAEAGLLGLGASTAGLLLGTALVQAALTVLARVTDTPLPGTVDVTWAAVVVPLVVGVTVTVLASLSPARAATRVSPLAALRPDGAPSLGDRAGRARAWTSGTLVAGGLAMLVGGRALATQSMELGLVVAMLGGALSFFGVLVGAVFWVPGLLGRLVRVLDRRGSGVARLAAANTVRNPRRVAATSGALFIGVTLVTMMSTGAASAEKAFMAGLSSQFPVDAVVAAPWLGEGPGELPAGFAERVAEVPGVADTMALRESDLEIEVAGQPITLTSVVGVDPARAQDLLLDPALIDGLTDDTILWPVDDTVAVGDTVTVSGPAGSRELTVAGFSGLAAVTDTTLATLASDAPTSQLWVRIDDLARADRTVGEIQELATDDDAGLQVSGAAVERAFFQRVVDTLLAIVVGLLGVAVVIAVVGVANTLSLSVIERRRESATLRAIGLTRRQLRAMLALEGLLLAAVGAAVGAVLGVAYGWAGTSTLLASVQEVSLVVPWSDLALVLAVALGAGLLASVLPARSAARTSPVAALASE